MEKKEWYTFETYSKLEKLALDQYVEQNEIRTAYATLSGTGSAMYLITGDQQVEILNMLCSIEVLELKYLNKDKK